MARYRYRFSAPFRLKRKTSSTYHVRWRPRRSRPWRFVGASWQRGQGGMGRGPYQQRETTRTPAATFEGLGAGRTKVLWIKPVGARLEVTGRRLDGPAAPLAASLPEGYPGDFQARGLEFPSGGCWEVEARPAGGGPGSSLRVVLAVRPT